MMEYVLRKKMEYRWIYGFYKWNIDGYFVGYIGSIHEHITVIVYDYPTIDGYACMHLTMIPTD